MKHLERDSPMRCKFPVFVNGVWKSGNHLAYSALNLLGVPGPRNGIAAHLVNGRYMFAKRLLRTPWWGRSAVEVGLETDASVSSAWLARQLRGSTGRILGGHAAYSTEFVSELTSVEAKLIFIRRDPRDVLVSFADWVGSRPDFYLHEHSLGLSREDCIRALLRGFSFRGQVVHPFSVVLERASGWLSLGPETLQVSFEDLVGPRGGGEAQKQRQAVSAIREHLELELELSDTMLESIYGGTLTFNHGTTERWRSLEDRTLVMEIEESLSGVLGCWGYS